MNFASTWNKLIRHDISVDFLLMEVSAQGALRKEVHTTPFVERFNTAILGRSC